MSRAITQRHLRPVIDGVFAFAEAKDAYRHFESRAHFGESRSRTAERPHSQPSSDRTDDEGEQVCSTRRSCKKKHSAIVEITMVEACLMAGDGLEPLSLQLESVGDAGWPVVFVELILIG
jgi:hypothetical protein